MAPSQRPLLPLLLLLLPLPPPPPFARAQDAARANSDRYAVYWNRSNPRFHAVLHPKSPSLMTRCWCRRATPVPSRVLAVWAKKQGAEVSGTESPLLRQSPTPSLPAATPPNAVDRPCLRLKVYVRPTNETLYEAPEPIFTSNNSCSGLGSCRLVLSTVPVLWTLLGS
ncbi:ephrin-A2 [Eumetopias jubatus]|uniref:ephrin-A2 n=1 Tax=Eumetopias jubatus TaxID=34886 RepID=UPI001016C548|nr:ephrin-A2 [Eumetopias jubatus]